VIVYQQEATVTSNITTAPLSAQFTMELFHGRRKVGTTLQSVSRGKSDYDPIVIVTFSPTVSGRFL